MKEKGFRVRLWEEACHKVTILIKPLQILGLFKYRQFECITEPEYNLILFSLLCPEPDCEWKTASVTSHGNKVNTHFYCDLHDEVIRYLILLVWPRSEGFGPLKCQAQRSTKLRVLGLSAYSQSHIFLYRAGSRIWLEKTFFWENDSELQPWV